MKKDDNVQFTGKLPKELAKVKGPVYGTVIRVDGLRIVVKPRYKRFEVTISKVDLTVVDYEKFHKAQKVKRKSPKKKVIAKAPAKVTAAVVKAAAEVKNKAPFVSSPETIAKVSKAESVEETKEILEEAKIEKIIAEGKYKAETLVEPVVSITNCDDSQKWNPTSTAEKDKTYAGVEEAQGKGMLIWTIVFIGLALAAIAYFTLR